ncbi:mitochondrial FAD-linked sulfhydryl oxidase ERV1 [Aulographum hederae CBS 113979]|uniref:Sulfhydryl oxidase n=1 Tax=Aulographum hederae CBS 113979 TaxID=1176131 RepID=A0A6G1GYD0_9PEZI|nr:mitochondrial FAD-linked sulfhydryl oxidase ERV1 [Aulographum hederae CBS 113979]
MALVPDDVNAASDEKKNGDVATTTTQKLPKGMVLGPDGKPCRACNSKAAFSSWAAMAKGKVDSPQTTTAATSTPTTSALSTDDCPPDVETLGRSSWTLLHTITASYPPRPSPALQRDTTTFLSLFAQLYPCWTCAEDFQKYIASDNGRPRVSSREEFGRWMCEAHNAVNEKLGKERFDCGRWEERWRTGWKDGRCD